MEELISNLFLTKSIKACEADKPFWLTSGKIGAYFINAEFLYGNEEESKKLLQIIDESLSNRNVLPEKIFKNVSKQYQSNEIYKHTIDFLLQTITKNIDVNNIDYISGGERRDWVFSYIIANLLKKPHITIFKDLSMLVSNSDFTNTEQVKNLEGKKCLHISDLITEAASYVNMWLPAIKEKGGEMKWTATIVDRMQGGDEILLQQNVVTYPLVKVNKELFKTALEKRDINNEQYLMINNYIDNPYETMRKFLISHPEFIKNSLESSGKTLIRVKKCINDDLYNLKGIVGD